MNDNDILILNDRLQKAEEALEEAQKEIEEMSKHADAEPVMRFGVYSAIVISTFDIWKQNRVQYYMPTTDEATPSVDGLPWASPISNFGGFDDCGASWVPPAGSKICIVFENGMNGAAYYLGSVWTRRRGPKSNNDFGFPIPEFDSLYTGENLRNGYLCGPDDGSQVLPPWNTESYNGFDIDSTTNLDKDPNSVLRQTYPNIYGFKTPEKHMMKMVDGDPDCNRKWKRIEIMSGNGNWMIFKDDHLHYAGQWAHPDCQSNKKRIGDTSCVTGVPNPKDNKADSTRNQPYNNQEIGEFEPEIINFEEISFGSEKAECEKDKTSKTIIGGPPETQLTPDSQKGTNPFFKSKNECRPYKGPQTPQNNKCDLPQTGIQILSISGHTFVMDDSVAQPRGGMTWKRGLDPFDFGCNDKYYGRTYWKSATGHIIEMNDLEREQGEMVRSEKNGIKFKSALGNQIFLCDAVTGKKYDEKAAPEQGISLTTTSNHQITMSDGGNKRKYEARKEGANPESKATDAFIRIKTGYGLSIEMSDANSQEKTAYQSIKITAPQKDKKNNPHLIEMQELKGTGYLRLRAGGNYILESNDSAITIMNKSSINYVKEQRLDFTEKEHYMRSNKQIILQSADKIYLLAGEDAVTFRSPQQSSTGNTGNTDLNQQVEQSVKTNTQQKGPRLAPVVVFDGKCLKVSDRVFATCSQQASGISLGSLKLPDSLAVTGVDSKGVGVTGSAKLPAGC